MKKKIRVGVLFGGRSAEHEISLISAGNVARALDPKKYEPVLIGIDKQGRWHAVQKLALPQEKGNARLSNGKQKKISGEAMLQSTAVSVNQKSLDVVFPVLHGPFGEDGTVQGLLKLAGIPFVGASVLGSAVGMDKDVMKRLLRETGIPVGTFLVFRENEKRKINFAEARQLLGRTMFVKPANLGSSVGVSKVTNEGELARAVKEAFQYDRKILIEQAITGREIECAVLGNETPQASGCGEVIPQGKHSFYSYDAKYLDENGALLEIPAKISSATERKIRKLAVRAFQALECEGMARIDFFLKDNGEILVNEINTIPGFTKISMYPKLWEKSGVSYNQLVDRLIQLALERHRQEVKLRTDRH